MMGDWVPSRHGAGGVAGERRLVSLLGLYGPDRRAAGGFDDFGGHDVPLLCIASLNPLWIGGIGIPSEVGSLLLGGREKTEYIQSVGDIKRHREFLVLIPSNYERLSTGQIYRFSGSHQSCVGGHAGANIRHKLVARKDHSLYMASPRDIVYAEQVAVIDERKRKAERISGIGGGR